MDRDVIAHAWEYIPIQEIYEFLATASWEDKEYIALPCGSRVTVIDGTKPHILSLDAMRL